MTDAPSPPMPASGAGRCLCGATRYSWSAAPLWTGLCHCDSCRRSCAAPVTGFFGVADDAWKWTAAAPAVYESSPGVRRSFCGLCGSPMAFAADKFPGETHFYAASMDSPEDFTPEQHFHHGEAVPWLHLDDTLPRHEGSAI